jgi:hypothetical protein
MAEKAARHARWQFVAWTAWEYVASACFVLAAVVKIASASSLGGVVWGIALLAVFVAGLAWLRRLYRSRPDLVARRAPVEILWLVGAVALFMGSGVFTESSVSDKVISGLIALGLLAMIVGERTRQVPAEHIPYIRTGGAFDFTQPAARARFKRWNEILSLVAIAVLIGLWFITHDSLTLFFIPMILIYLGTFELGIWIAKKQKLGYFALDDK